jgi:hypothetical protein
MRAFQPESFQLFLETGGEEEYAAVQAMAARVHPEDFTVLQQRILNRPTSPILMLFLKKQEIEACTAEIDIDDRT